MLMLNVEFNIFVHDKRPFFVHSAQHCALINPQAPVQPGKLEVDTGNDTVWHALSSAFGPNPRPATPKSPG